LALCFDPNPAPDVPSGKYFRRTQSFDGFNRAFSGQNTSVVMFAAPSVFYGISLIRKNSVLRLRRIDQSTRVSVVIVLPSSHRNGVGILIHRFFEAQQIKGTVQKAGMSMDDIVSMQVFCTDLALYDAFNSVYRTYFKAFPARAFTGGSKLLFGARFEVLGLAVKK
jgi:hypothetical protein